MVETVPIAGRSATLVRPRDGIEGRMGVLLDLSVGKVWIIALNLTRGEQAVAQAIFQSIRPVRDRVVYASSRVRFRVL